MASLDDLPLRADLVGRTPYGAPQLDVPVRLNVNENAFAVDQTVIDDVVASVRDAIADVHRYPDREFTPLREAFAAYLGHGLEPAHIWAANGSNEVLQHVLQAFGGPGRTLLSFAPTYSMYPLLAQGVGAAYVAEPRADDFTLDAETVVAAIERHDPDAVFLCAPNNPTGTALPLEVIEAACEAVRGIVLVDEAYAEFAHDRSQTALALLPRFERLIVSRTMSKAFAFAGARVGYLAADPALIDALRLVRLPYHLSALTQAAATAALRLVRLPYHLSALTQAAALAALRHAPTMLARVDELRAQRDRIVAALADLGFEPYPSDANFVLFGGVADPVATFEGLLADGVLIRDVGIPRTLRVTAGTPAETDAFLASIARFAPAQRP